MNDVLNGFHPLSIANLPVFQCDYAAYALFYTPGLVTVVEKTYAAEFADTFRQYAASPEGALQETPQQKYTSVKIATSARVMWQQARQTIESTSQIAAQPFAPECLTLYMNNECNLQCSYCYAEPDIQPTIRLTDAEILAGARLVAANCQRKGLPLTVVFHGGGEPMLHRDRAESALAIVQQVAKDYGLELFRYVATNGVMNENKARWLAANCELAGLSCDGPPDIQNRHRPRYNGRITSKNVARTAMIFQEMGRPFQVRATITPDSIDQQAEIAEYICSQLKPKAIAFEAVYVGGKTDEDATIAATLAERYVKGLLDAQEVAKKYNIPLTSSGSRLEVLHGPYCNVFRQTLNLVPGGGATGCFKITDAESAKAQHVLIAKMANDGQTVLIDDEAVRRMYSAVEKLPEKCTACFNQHHCVRDCPDACAMLSDTALPYQSFRCQSQRLLTAHILSGIADDLWQRSAQTDNDTAYRTLSRFINEKII